MGSKIVPKPEGFEKISAANNRAGVLLLLLFLLLTLICFVLFFTPSKELLIFVSIIICLVCVSGFWSNREFERFRKILREQPETSVRMDIFNTESDMYAMVSKPNDGVIWVKLSLGLWERRRIFRMRNVRRERQYDLICESIDGGIRTHNSGGPVLLRIGELEVLGAVKNSEPSDLKLAVTNLLVRRNNE